MAIYASLSFSVARFIHSTVYTEVRSALICCRSEHKTGFMQVDCERQFSLLNEELELQRASVAIPDAAPSSLILYLLTAAKSADEPSTDVLPTSQQITVSGILPTMPEEASWQNASPPAMQQDESAEPNQANDSPRDHRHTAILPHEAQSYSDGSGLGNSDAQESSSLHAENQPFAAATANRDLGLLTALHAIEQSVNSLQQHVARLQAEGRVSRLQLNRLSKEVQKSLDSNASLAASMAAQRGSDKVLSKQHGLEGSETKENHTADSHGDLIKTATLKEAEIHAEMLDLRRALETLTGVIAALALGKHPVSKQQVTGHPFEFCFRLHNWTIYFVNL